MRGGGPQRVAAHSSAISLSSRPSKPLSTLLRLCQHVETQASLQWVRSLLHWLGGWRPSERASERASIADIGDVIEHLEAVNKFAAGIEISEILLSLLNGR